MCWARGKGVAPPCFAVNFSSNIGKTTLHWSPSSSMVVVSHKIIKAGGKNEKVRFNSGVLDMKMQALLIIKVYQDGFENW